MSDNTDMPIDSDPQEVAKSMDEVHIYSFNDLFQGDLSGKKLVVHSKAAAEYLKGLPSQAGFWSPSTTNDPQAEYAEAIGAHGLTQKRLQELCVATGISEGRFSNRLLVSKVIDALLASGELLRRDELVEWLKDSIAVANAMVKQAGPRGEGVGIGYQFVLDHINTKKAVSQAGVVATANIPLGNIGPVIEAGDVLVQDGATQRTTIVATSLFGERPEASDRERLTWYVDYRAGETEYRVVEQLPER